MGSALTLYSSVGSERMEIERILSEAPDDAVFYVCGPSRLIDAVTGIAAKWNIDSERIRSERFAAPVNPDSKPIPLELRRSGKRLRVPGHRSIVDAMLEAGVDAPFGCRERGSPTDVSVRRSGYE